MYQLTKSVTFDAAHRLRDYVGKCANLHGHTYKLEVAIAGEKVDEVRQQVKGGGLAAAKAAGTAVVSAGQASNTAASSDRELGECRDREQNLHGSNACPVRRRCIRCHGPLR